MQASDSSFQHSRMPLWVAVTALLHGLLYLAVYRQQALGRMAVLDGREILELASAYANGAVDGPFFRGPLYAWLLSLPLRIGLPEGLLHPLAQFLNVGAHAFSAICVFCLAKDVWNSARAGLAAGLLWALYPVAVYFAADPFDISFAIAWMLGALVLWRKTLTENGQRAWLSAIGSGLAMAMAFAVRPQMLAAGVGLALASLLLGRGWLRAANLAGLIFGLTLFCGANYWQSGQWRLLPTQGGYNLWAANGPTANGRYFQQSEAAWQFSNDSNPARQEAQAVYRHLHDLSADTTVAEADVDRYWQRRALQYIEAHPGAWTVLQAHKLMALLHNAEHYNNKTYALHKAMSPILRWNFLGWGALFLLSLIALAGNAFRLNKMARGLILVAVCYAAGVWLYYVSARFRLPIAAILTTFAGGSVLAFAANRRKAIRIGLPVAALLGVLIFWPFRWADPSNTYVEDWMLIASASDRIGDHESARQAAETAVRLGLDQPKPWQVLCAVEFNAALDLWAIDAHFKVPSRLLDACDKASGSSPLSAWSHAFGLWVAGDRDTAIARWRQLTQPGHPMLQRAVACLSMAGQDFGANGLVDDLPYTGQIDLLLYAHSSLGDTRAFDELVRRHGRDATLREAGFYARIFAL